MVDAREKQLNGATVTSRVPAVRKRHSDQAVFNQMMNIIEDKEGVSTKLQNIQTILKKEETVNSILMEKIMRRSKIQNSDNSEKREQYLYDAGAPAEWVAHEEQLRRRKAADQEEARAGKEPLAEKWAKRRSELLRVKVAETSAEKWVPEREKTNTKTGRPRATSCKVLQRKKNAIQREHIKKVRRCTRQFGQKLAKGMRSNSINSHQHSGKPKHIPVSSFLYAAQLVFEVVGDAADVGSEGFAVFQITPAPL